MLPTQQDDGSVFSQIDQRQEVAWQPFVAGCTETASVRLPAKPAEQGGLSRSAQRDGRFRTEGARWKESLRNSLPGVSVTFFVDSAASGRFYLRYSRGEELQGPVDYRRSDFPVCPYQPNSPTRPPSSKDPPTRLVPGCRRVGPPLYLTVRMAGRSVPRSKVLSFLLLSRQSVRPRLLQLGRMLLFGPGKARGLPS